MTDIPHDRVVVRVPYPPPIDRFPILNGQQLGRAIMATDNSMSKQEVRICIYILCLELLSSPACPEIWQQLLSDVAPSKAVALLVWSIVLWAMDSWTKADG